MEVFPLRATFVSLVAGGHPWSCRIGNRNATLEETIIASLHHNKVALISSTFTGRIIVVSVIE